MEFLYKHIRETVQNLLSAEKAGNAIEARIIKATLNTAIRKWGDYEKPHFVSVKAQEVADRIGVNLFDYTWPTQYKFDKGRKIFIMEHKYPVSDMIADMKQNPDNIEEIMKSSEFGWILKTEDERLPSYNRGDHDSVYEEANIELIRR